MARNYIAMTDAKKVVYQVYYTLSGLPTDICRLLLASTFPLFETRTTEYDKKWRQPVRRGIRFSQTQRKQNSLKLKKYTHHLQEEWTQQEQKEKEKLEKRTAKYGRPDITQTTYNKQDNGYSSSQLTHITSLATKRPHKLKHLAIHPPHISVTIIPLQIGPESTKQKISILIIMDKETTLISAHTFKRLGPKSIRNNVKNFVNVLSEYQMHREEIHFVNSGNFRRKRSIAKTIKLLQKDFPKMDISLDEKYDFKNKYQLNLDMDKKTFNTKLQEALNRYNIGTDRKRPKPYLSLRGDMKESRLVANKKTITTRIETITKLSK